ncbi:MAG: helix-turn-helix transcriptional regulator [Treponemataceae bacterium]|nr:helix-turn-helix transcriptional regulator [Spirochaetales bacterium]MDY6030209.1 helix-turn-helix transcriptional regulator [Treponemataceae bacterium]
MELRELFIANLKKYRKENGFSQMALAEKCETSASYIGEIEIGKKFPSIEMIQKISQAMNIKPYKLFFDETEVPDSVQRFTQQDKHELLTRLQSAVEQIITEY